MKFLTLFLLNSFLCFSIYSSEYQTDDKIYVKNSTGRAISIHLTTERQGVEYLRRVESNEKVTVELSKAQFKFDHIGIRFSDRNYGPIYIKKICVGQTYNIKEKIIIEEI